MKFSRFIIAVCGFAWPVGNIDLQIFKQTGNDSRSYPAAIAGTRWAGVRRAIINMSSGDINYTARLGAGRGRSEVRVHAAWGPEKLFIEILRPVKSRSAVQISESILTDWCPADKDKILTSRSLNKVPDKSLANPFSLGTVLCLLWDPLNPWFEMVGEPDGMIETKRHLTFSFPPPKGYSGLGFECTVDKRTLHPLNLRRSGIGMPDLEVSYEEASETPMFTNLNFDGKRPSRLTPTMHVAFTGSRFYHLYERALMNIQRH